MSECKYTMQSHRILVIGESHSDLYDRDGIKRIYIEGITMHRVGRDGVFSLHSKENIMDEGYDVIVVVCGEVDCRCHVYLQLQKGRDLDEILHTLASNYMSSLALVKQELGNRVQVFARGIVPPLRDGDHPDIAKGDVEYPYPIRGSLEERIAWRMRLNDLVAELASQQGVGFIPSPPWAENEDHTMVFEMSDKIIHIHNNYAERACSDLMEHMQSALKM